MRRFVQIVCAAGLLALAATPARADGFITPYWGYNFGGDSANCVSLTNCNEKRTNWGVSFGATQRDLRLRGGHRLREEFFRRDIDRRQRRAHGDERFHGGRAGRTDSTVRARRARV